jgi:hypothetical protein
VRHALQAVVPQAGRDDSIARFYERRDSGCARFLDAPNPRPLACPTIPPFSGGRERERGAQRRLARPSAAMPGNGEWGGTFHFCRATRGRSSTGSTSWNVGLGGRRADNGPVPVSELE